jgi:hypothetical protein
MLCSGVSFMLCSCVSFMLCSRASFMLCSRAFLTCLTMRACLLFDSSVLAVDSDGDRDEARSLYDAKATISCASPLPRA